MPTYESHVTTSPVFDKPAKIIYPFAEIGDYTTKEVHQPLLQLADQYAPPTLDSAFSTSLANLSGSPVSIGSAYCIGDTQPQPAEAGLVSFTRKWSNIPATYTDYIGSMAYTYPGRPNNTTSVDKTITAVGSISGNIATYTVTAHGYSVGQVVHIVVTYTNGRRNSWKGTVLSVTTNTFVTTYYTAQYLLISNGIVDTTIYPFSSGTVSTAAAFGSKPRTRGASAYVVNEFCLPGVTSGFSTILDFKPYDIFQVLDLRGNVADSLSVSTIPNDSEYNIMVAQRTGLVVDSAIERYAGNIYVRKTTYVQAI